MKATATIRALAPDEKMSIDEAFPNVDALISPSGNQVLVQFRCVKKYSAGGLLIVQNDQDFEAEKIRVAKVLAHGPIAYHDRKTHEAWPEGAWCQVGQYIRTPAYAGADQWKRTIVDDRETQRTRDNYARQCHEIDRRIAELRENADLTFREEKEIADMVDERKRMHTPETIYKDIHFAFFNDYDIKGVITGDPMDISDYI